MIWNRPVSTFLTVKSLSKALEFSERNVRWILLDQNSGHLTKTVIHHLVKSLPNVHLISSRENLGIARGWEMLLKEFAEEYLLFLENDWLCDSISDWFIRDGIEILASHDECAFVKLRSIHDRNDFGWGKIHYAPWSVPGGHAFMEEHQTDAERKYWMIPSSHSGFTLNPILARKDFVEEILPYFLENRNWANVLRSGEEAPSTYWRGQRKWKSATLTSGPFRHTGFYDVHDKLLTFPTYFIRFLRNGRAKSIP